MALLVVWSVLDLFYNIYWLDWDSWDISQALVSCLHTTSNQTLVQLYFSLAAEVINYWTWKTLANTILQNRQRINKIHRAFTALKRIIIEDLKRCRAREWELNGASCCFTDSFRAIWNYILITFLFFWAGKSQEIVLLLTFWGCQLLMFKWFGGNWFVLKLIFDFEDAISIGSKWVLMGEWRRRFDENSRDDKLLLNTGKYFDKI